MKTLTKLTLVLCASFALVACGKEKSACEKSWDSVNKIPEFASSVKEYGNKEKALFLSVCSKLSTEGRACIDKAKTSEDLINCEEIAKAYMALE